MTTKSSHNREGQRPASSSLLRDDVYCTETRYQQLHPTTSSSAATEVLLQPTPRTSNHHYNRRDDSLSTTMNNTRKSKNMTKSFIGEKHRRGPSSSSLRHTNTSDDFGPSEESLPPLSGYQHNNDEGRRRDRRNSKQRDKQSQHQYSGSVMKLSWLNAVNRNQVLHREIENAVPIWRRRRRYETMLILLELSPLLVLFETSSMQ